MQFCQTTYSLERESDLTRENQQTKFYYMNDNQKKYHENEMRILMDHNGL